MHRSDSADAEETQRVIALARAARFKDFTDDELGMITARARHLTVPEHWALMTECTAADKAYLILAGEASVRVHGEEVNRVGPGELIGEMALVNHQLRSATVIAETPLEVLHFTSEDVAALQEQIPRFRDALTSTSAERLGTRAGD